MPQEESMTEAEVRAGHFRRMTAFPLYSADEGTRFGLNRDDYITTKIGMCSAGGAHDAG